MGIIQTLPSHVANLIAAGEVIERPASVAKELIENAIDAGAKHISVEIKNGGVSFLRVTDDGKGMVPEDARTCFLRHATSKIAAESDLIAIATLGFRGEALAAAAAVSKIDLLTRTKAQELGVHVSIEGGKEIDFFETGCPCGTTVIVRELFYNVPARMKFLKKDATEGGHVESAAVCAALSRPDIAFEFIKDGREVFHTSGDGRMPSVIYAVFGDEVASGVMSVVGSFGDISLEGYISPPSFTRASKDMQHFFVNGRCVRSRLLTAALEQGYKNRVLSGRSPVCFINLKVSLSAVDVNVHPSKLEIKFSREREVFSALFNAVALTLDGAILGARPPEREERPPALTPVINLSARGPTSAESHAQSHRQLAQPPVLPYQTQRELEGVGRGFKAEPEPWQTALKRADGRLAEPPVSPAVEKPAPQLEAPAQNTEHDMRLDRPVRVVGEVFQTYIIVESDGGLWLVDKHAAHERMIFDRLSAGRGAPMSQLLMEPLAVALTGEEKAVCLSNPDRLFALGFEVEDVGMPSLLVRAIPAYLELGDAAYVLSDIARKLRYHKGAESELFEELLKSISCKAAVRSGDRNEQEELEQFIAQLIAMPEVRHCPHGRPVAVSLTRRELEKMFKR